MTQKNEIFICDDCHERKPITEEHQNEENRCHCCCFHTCKDCYKKSEHEESDEQP